MTVGLRQFVERESSEVTVGQRLKRNPQILNKLDRFGSMRLTQMEDIAGCRAILPGGATEVAGVLRRIRRNWEVLRIEDYVASPKDTGYRALHVVVRRDGHPVEIQLRTPGQHEWAEVERQVTALRQLASVLGATLLIEEHDDLVAAVGRVVRERGSTYIMVGESKPRRGFARLREPLPQRLMEATPPGVDVRIVAYRVGEEKP